MAPSRGPEYLLGRVNGTAWTLVLAALPVGSLAFGALVAATGIAAAVVVGGLVMAGVFWLLPAMRLVDGPAPVHDDVRDEDGAAAA